jgi:subtilisin family serine protease
MAVIRGEVPQTTSPQPASAPTVVVKLEPPAPGVAAESIAGAPQRLQAVLPESLVARPYFVEALRPGAIGAEATAEAPTGELANFVAIEVASPQAGEELARSLRQRADVAEAYVESGPTPPPAAPVGSNPRSASQRYLEPAPEGIDARWAWVNAAGNPVCFVDLEQGWTLNHEDLASASISLISGLNQAYHGHGTAVLGEVAAVDNSLGVVGIAFGGRARVISQYRPDGRYSTALAIRAAAAAMNRGDVLLLEAQVMYPATNGRFHPVEAEQASFDAIRDAVDRGIIVIEAGGNGTVDLDAFRDPSGRNRLNRNSPDFRDSGAIMVGAATSFAPHQRLGFSNFGSRIDCYAWGENIETCGDGWEGNLTNTYTSFFGGTSGASPIVTGAALLLQGWAAGRGQVYSPADLRRLMSDRTLNTPSMSPAADRIGVMPNLRAIVQSELAHPPPAAVVPAPVIA